jgi:serine/threonine protein phosphatase PrpC/DNA-binding transcriptional MerR regulator
MLVGVDELLSIGTFSQRCGLSPKMLRTYAAAGVLVPAAVDPGTGYRYYAPGQLHAATVIAALRRAQVPLAEIATFLADPDEARFDQWERDREVELRVRRAALADARALLPLVHPRPAVLAERPPTPGAQMMSTLTTGSATDIGQVRTRNQDGVLAGDAVFGVADGLGDGGELASTLALETLRVGFAADPTADGLSTACHEANRVVWGRAQQEAELANMGTTLTAAAVLPDASGLAVVNVGDSRAYLLRDGELRRVTRDHSMVQDLVDAGELTDEEARTHPQRPILTRVLGMGPAIEPDLFHLPIRDGDRVLLCTDGVVAELDDDAIGAVLAAGDEPGRTASELVREATAHGGQDNASAVVVDVARASLGPDLR